MWNALEQMLHIALGAIVLRCQSQLRQILRHRPDVLVDGPTVVIEEHDEVSPEIAGAIQSFERLAARECAIAEHGNDGVLLPVQIARERHAERRRNRRARMPDTECVVGRLETVGKPCDAALGAKRRKPIPTSREDLVRIGLMSDIPDELIRRKIKNVIERERQLHCTKARREMTAGLRHMLDHERTNL